MDSSERGQHWRNYSSFGLFRDDEDPDRRNTYSKSRRFQLSFAVVAVALLIVTGVFVALQVTRSTTETIAKAKRFVHYDDAEPPTKKPQIDVDIFPETIKYPNHRYDQQQSKDHIVERMMKNIYNEWSPEEEPTTRNNIRDIIRRIEKREKLRKSTEKRNPMGMGKPILFKGVYMKKAKTDGFSEDASDREYFKEINEMLQGEDKPTEEKSVHSRRGSPFQLKSQADLDDENMGKAGEEIRKKTKKPITVMLDIYPVTKPEEEVEEKVARKKKKEMPFFFSEPVPSGGKNIAYTLVPVKGGRQLGLPNVNRMIMKLNLYPKKKTKRLELDEMHPEMNRRTFGWFKKKPDGHVCQLIGHNPEWKPVTAEWKDEHGDWIKANYVTLKYWDRKFT